jgi:ATP-dependent DNA helicase RecG
MKSSQSNTNKLTWESSILELTARKPSQSLLKIHDAGFKTIKDLLWIFPLRVQKDPKVSSFSEMIEGQLFKGSGKVINCKFSPAYGRRGKRNIQLFNATVVVKDLLSDKYVNLKWFNTYPGLKKQLEAMDDFTFMGQVTDFKGTIQIVNPKINPKEEKNNNGVLIEYPTINTVAGRHVKSIIEKIPTTLWDTPMESQSSQLGVNDNSHDSLNHSFRILHGLEGMQSSDVIELAKERLIYEEFFEDQLKVLARRMTMKSKDSPFLTTDSNKIEKLKGHFPYILTEDQSRTIEEVIKDFKSGHPMMRIVQGDVGCGKTTVAIIASLIAIQNGFQVALMCPTEQLARQHAKTFSEITKNMDIPITLLLGSTKTKEKNNIYQQLQDGTIPIVIGTHSLFQDAVIFNKLGLCIIDEQHKFGVEQRLKLVNKGEGTHCLIMTATPIPRTLQLAQFGDLDISSIKTIPKGRKGIKTRIVKQDNYQNYLSFIKTRISLGEQVYVVVPAISESILDIKNVEDHEKVYRKFFPNLKIASLHGQLKADDKQQVMEKFNQGEYDILISTSVIEVGINVLNATVMSIYNPERFGLSSLHQLRGRVGRGEKPGFCFLVCDQNTSKEGLQRLGVVEKTNDGFQIAEADLKIRGQGDLFGVNQSGNVDNKKLANIFEHYDIFQNAINDINKVKELPENIIWDSIKHLTIDDKISSTI